MQRQYICMYVMPLSFLTKAPSSFCCSSCRASEAVWKSFWAQVIRATRFETKQSSYLVPLWTMCVCVHLYFFYAVLVDIHVGGWYMVHCFLLKVHFLGKNKLYFLLIISLVIWNYTTKFLYFFSECFKLFLKLKRSSWNCVHDVKMVYLL